MTTLTRKPSSTNSGNKNHHPAFYASNEVSQAFPEHWWQCLTSRQSLSTLQEWGNVQTRNLTKRHTGINHLSPKRIVSTTEKLPKATVLLLWSVTPSHFFTRFLSENKKVNPRQLKKHDVTWLPIAITKLSNRTWPAQQVSCQVLEFPTEMLQFLPKMLPS